MIYQFGPFKVDDTLFEVWRDDTRLEAQPQVIELLIMLVENHDRVVTREEIFDHIWKDRVVSDTTLSSRIKSIRKLLGDDGVQQKFIRTIHGRGFRFHAEVATTERKTFDRFLHSVTYPVEPNNFQVSTQISPDTYEVMTGERFELPDKPSIAVLPFQNMSGESEQEYFADGMSEDIITALSRVPDLVVIARNSTFVYKSRTVDVRQVGRELGVRHVLEGGIRRNGNQLRITAQLVDTLSGDHVWAERYDRKLDDIFAVQDEITHKIVVELHVKLVSGEISRLVATGTNSVAAWELVIRAGSLTDSQVRDDTIAAKQLLRQALHLDSNYSTAWTMLGWVYWGESVWKWCSEPEESMQKAFDAAQKAISTDINFPGGYSLLGNIHMVRGETNQAIAMNEKAVELAPSNSLALSQLSNVLIDSGRLKEGIQKMPRAIRLCPFPPVWYLSVLGAGFHLNGDNEAAISVLGRAADQEPNSVLSRLWLASTLGEIGRLDEARALSNRVLEIEPDFSAVSWANSFKSKSHARLKSNMLAAGFPE